MLEKIPFESFADFIDMGGYGFNVWAVYLLFVIFVLVNLLGPLRRKKRIMLQLKRRQTLANSADAGGGENIGLADGLTEKPIPGDKP
ncbi:MAG: hypothetical protein RLZZ385_2258 [Pseudomonadota bacterium]|jgi:heme exporter protein D